ncbi:TetR/AcrR family transcriptional regulator [Demequina gelatinilytica]|uniref:TetR/AcrR family transcriptional regulator n=1 Tax=Demequina gelatinilytica TaxID=1638980 RepID=UPI0007806CE6|nr:TetR/AcrR family transcriptional regulator [Demequina gelatinilytica]
MSSDGRDTRWEQHRADRRRELVSHALRAIRVHGPGVALEDIATRAGTSKTVIYRHFGDRAGLYAAVVESVHAYIHAGLTTALELTDTEDLGRMAGDLADAYLSLVERDPHIYRFVLAVPVATPAGAPDPAGNLPAIMGTHVSAAIGAHLERTGADASSASIWGHGLVGFIRAAADQWMDASPRPPRADVVAHITAIFAPGFTGALSPSPALGLEPA